MSISQSLNTFGYATVIAFTHRPPSSEAKAPDPAEAATLTRHFASHPDSQLALATAASAQAGGPAGGTDEASRYYENLGIVYGTVDRAGLAALRQDPLVGNVVAAPQLSLIRPVAAGAVAPPKGRTWGIERLGAATLWDRGLSGKGVRVAHLDTGVDADHPTLADAVKGFAELDVAGREVPGAAARDSDLIEGHGTHTAATLAGRVVDEHRVGVAPGAELYCALVIEGGDIIARVLGGMNWAVGNNVRILSMSLGIRTFVTDFLGVIDVLRDSGVLPIIAVGNEGAGTSRSPGNYPTVLSVGYHDDRSAVAELSSSQRFKRRKQPLVPDVVAPGQDTISAAPGGGWRSLSGSSMAVPHVAGIAALLFEAHPDATIEQVEQAITRSARLGSMTKERANHGAVDAVRALDSLG